MDFLAMIPIPLASVLLYYLLKIEIIKYGKFAGAKLFLGLELLLLTGIYLCAAGSGDHEVTNYLNTRFCAGGKAQSMICQAIIYNDDEFSHYIYYAGFIFMNIALMFIEYKSPRLKPIAKKDIYYIGINSFFIALGIFANLAFEEIGIDLWVFGVVMVLSLGLLFKGNNKPKTLPITIYFAISYTLGVLATFIYKTFNS